MSNAWLTCREKGEAVASFNEVFVRSVQKLGADPPASCIARIQVFSQSKPSGNSVAIVSNAGGLAVLTADWCDRLGLTIPLFSPKIVEKLRSYLPPIASPHNPVDMTGDAGYDRYKKVLETISKERTIDVIISIFVSQGLITSDGPARAAVEIQRDYPKPMLACWMGGTSIINGVRILLEGGVPVYSSPERVAKATATLIKSRL